MSDIDQSKKRFLGLLGFLSIMVILTIATGRALDGWGEKFANVNHGIDGMIMAVAFIVHIGVTLALFAFTLKVLIYFVAELNAIMKLKTEERTQRKATGHKQTP